MLSEKFTLKIWFVKYKAMLQKGFFFFLTQNFFSKALTNFSMRRMIMFNIFGRLSNIISLRSKKNQGHTTRQTDYMAGNVQSLDFLKIHFQNRVGEVHGFGSKMPIFEENFFFKCF